MTGRKTAIFLAAITLLTPLAHSQAVQQPTLEIGAGYSAEHTRYTSGTSLWLNGGFAEAAIAASHHMGVFTQVAGSYSAGKPGASPVGTLSVTAGPRLRLDVGRSRLFAEGALGIAHGFAGTFPTANGASSSWYAFASQAGGGYEYALRPHVAVRLFELQYVRTTFPNGTNNTQNNLRLGAGIVFRIPVS